MTHDSNHYSVGQLIKAVLLDTHDLKDRERLVLVAIVAHGNGMGFCEPSTAGIAEYIGCGERTIQSIVKKLIIAGRILATIRKGARTLYRITAATATIIRDRLTRHREEAKINPRNIQPEPPQNHGATPAALSGDVADEVGFEVPPEEENLSRTRDRKPSGLESQNLSSTTKPKRRFGDWKKPSWRNGKPILPTTAEACQERGHGHYWADRCTACAADEKVAAAAAAKWAATVDAGRQVAAESWTPTVVVPVKGMTNEERAAAILAKVAARKAA